MQSWAQNKWQHYMKWPAGQRLQYKKIDPDQLFTKAHIVAPALANNGCPASPPKAPAGSAATPGRCRCSPGCKISLSTSPAPVTISPFSRVVPSLERAWLSRHKASPAHSAASPAATTPTGSAYVPMAAATDWARSMGRNCASCSPLACTTHKQRILYRARTWCSQPCSEG